MGEIKPEPKRHYAVCHKWKLFKRFDKGLRPSDMANSPVKRETLYAYFSEWRRERGLPGKKIGFALRPFDRIAYDEARKKLMTESKSAAEPKPQKNWYQREFEKIQKRSKDGYYRE